MKTIILSGELGKRYGRVHKFNVRTPAEAVRALCANHKSFSGHLINAEKRGVAYKVFVDDEIMEDVDAHNGVAVPFSEVIRIAPTHIAGKKGFLGIIVGALLIGASFFLPGVALFGTTSLASMSFAAGTAMVLGGVSQLLAPQPKNDQAKEASYVFNGPVNTVRLGQGVPLGYGRLIVGGAVISAGITTDNLAAAGGVLTSDSYAKIIDLISEGEILGLATGDEKSIYLNKTRVKNDDGTFNFSKVTFDTRNGTQDQARLSNFSDVEREFSVNALVEKATPIVRSITDGDVDAVRVTIGAPVLSNIDSKGNPIPTKVQFKIDVQASGGSYVNKITDEFSGKAPNKYEREYVIPLVGDAPFNVKVSRITDDSANQNNVNAINWDRYTEIIDSRLTYPNSAIIGSTIYAEQFSEIPARAYDVKLKKIKIPANYNPLTRVYEDEWDGTFVTAWSNNPAWVFYDLLLNTRYGLGNYINIDEVDQWALYEIGQYCDELVSDGMGGLEPRFTCNLYLQEREEAYKVINDLASIFRGMVYWATGLIVAIQDSPADVSGIFTDANVIDGLFAYEGTSLKTRHSVAIVSWNDPDDFYALKPEYVEDADAMERYGFAETEFTALGCTSRAQAIRMAKWLLFSEGNETETIRFRVGIEGAIARPGQVISISNQNRAAARRGGRIVSATHTDIVLDKGFTPTPSVVYTLNALLPDGTLDSAPIASFEGNTVILATPLKGVPQPNSRWQISSVELEPELFRVLSVTEAEDNTFEIRGLKHNPSKYDAVERDLVLQQNVTSLVNTPPNPVTNITVSESLYNYPSGVSTRISLKWDEPDRAATYRIEYQRDGGGWEVLDNIRQNFFEITDVEPGSYDFIVYAVSYSKKRSVGQLKTQIIRGKLDPPHDVDNFSLVGVADGEAHLAWDRTNELDVASGGYVRIRHTPNIDDPNWSNAVDIGPALPGNATTANLPHLNGTYLAKFVDSGGRISANAAEVITTAASLTGLNFIETIDESDFSGTKDDVEYDGDLNGLVLSADGDAFATEGTYYFADPFDLGAVDTCLITALLGVIAFDAAGTIDDRLDNMDDWPDWDGAVVDDVNATLYIAVTDDDPTDPDAEWSSWRKFFVGQYRARGFKFKLVLTSPGNTHNIVAQELSVQIDMPDRTEAAGGIQSGAGTLPITFSKPFRVVPAIGITAHDMNSGDYWRLTSVTKSGFSVTFKNSSNAAVDRKFDWSAKGWGYEA